jgi:hypothetical protein
MAVCALEKYHASRVDGQTAIRSKYGANKDLRMREPLAYWPQFATAAIML